MVQLQPNIKGLFLFHDFNQKISFISVENGDCILPSMTALDPLSYTPSDVEIHGNLIKIKHCFVVFGGK